MRMAALWLPAAAGLVVGLALWPSSIEAKKCTGPKFSCDSPEGCEFQNQMMLKSAYRSVYADEGLAAQAIANAKADLARKGTKGPSSGLTPAEYDRMVQKQAAGLLEKAAADGASSLRLPACKGSSIKDPPGMVTVPTSGSSCIVKTVSGGVEAPVQDAYKNNPDACDEMIDASRVHEGYHAAHCDAVDKQITIDSERAEEQAAYSLEIQYLRDEMAAVGQWCTPTPKHRKRFANKARRATASALRGQASAAAAAGPK